MNAIRRWWYRAMGYAPVLAVWPVRSVVLGTAPTLAAAKEAAAGFSGGSVKDADGNTVGVILAVRASGTRLEAEAMVKVDALQPGHSQISFSLRARA